MTLCISSDVSGHVTTKGSIQPFLIHMHYTVGVKPTVHGICLVCTWDVLGLHLI
jgi:hypothetical protein